MRLFVAYVICCLATIDVVVLRMGEYSQKGHCGCHHKTHYGFQSQVRDLVFFWFHKSCRNEIIMWLSSFDIDGISIHVIS